MEPTDKPSMERLDFGDGGAFVCGVGPGGISDKARAELEMFAAYLRECGTMPKDDRPTFKEWKEGQWE